MEIINNNSQVNLSADISKVSERVLGEQLIVEFHGCDAMVLDDLLGVETIMLEAAKAANATVVAHKFHKFSPQGVSGAVIVAESHLAIHTWPEYNYSSVDIFTCGPHTDNVAALQVIKQGLGADRYEVVAVKMRSPFEKAEGDQLSAKSSLDITHVSVDDASGVTTLKPLVQENNRLVFRENYAAFGGMWTTIAVKRLLASEKSDYQKVEVYDTIPFGRMLTLDGIIMLTQYDNFAYHEMIAHLPLNAHPNPERVLIIGGGDGGTLKEVLKHDTVKEVVLCEIDKVVVDLSRKYFPEFSASFDDPRVTVVIGDGAEYIKSKEKYFDVVCVDSTDFFGPAEVLFRKEFYQGLQRALTDEGIAVTQSESMYYDKDFVIKLQKQNQQVFPVSAYYFTLVPTYPSGTIGFSYCSNKFGPTDNLDPERVARINGLNYYNAAIHQASFALPQFAKKAFGK